MRNVGIGLLVIGVRLLLAQSILTVGEGVSTRRTRTDNGPIMPNQ